MLVLNKIVVNTSLLNQRPIVDFIVDYMTSTWPEISAAMITVIDNVISALFNVSSGKNVNPIFKRFSLPNVLELPKLFASVNKIIIA